MNKIKKSYYSFFQMLTHIFKTLSLSFKGRTGVRGGLGPPTVPLSLSVPSRSGRLEAMQERIDGKLWLQFGTAGVLRWRRAVAGGSGDQMKVSRRLRGLVSLRVTLKDIRSQILSKDGFILTGNGCILSFQQLQGNSAHFYRPEVAFTLRFTGIL